MHNGNPFGLADGQRLFSVSLGETVWRVEKLPEGETIEFRGARCNWHLVPDNGRQGKHPATFNVDMTRRYDDQVFPLGSLPLKI